MDLKIDLHTVLNTINDLKSSSLLPRNWVKILASRHKVSETIIRDWASGRKNIPDGPITVLESMSEILEERKNKIRNLRNQVLQNNIN